MSAFHQDDLLDKTGCMKFSCMCTEWSSSDHCHKAAFANIQAKTVPGALAGRSKSGCFRMWLCNPHETSLACSKCQDVCEKANEWKTWCRGLKLLLYPAGFIRSVPLIPLAGPLCWNRPFPAGPCTVSYVRLAEREVGHPVVWTLDCLSFARTATIAACLRNPRNSHCLVAILITCRLTCVKDSMPFSVLPQRVTQSDERTIRLAKLCPFRPQILSSFPSSSSLEKLHTGRWVVAWRPGLISVGLQWNEVGVGHGFPRPGAGTGPCLCKKRGWFRHRAEYL